MKSKAWESVVEEALTKFSILEKQVLKRDYDDKEEVLQELFNIIRVVYKGVNLPCSTVNRIIGCFSYIFNLSGNLSRNHKYRCNLEISREKSIFEM